MRKILRFLNTIKYLKLKQISYRVFYLTRSRYRNFTNFRYCYSKQSTPTMLSLEQSIDYYALCRDKEFVFLNLSKKFDDILDWNYSGHGKLWTYNLTYFEYLKSKEDVNLLYDFVDNIETINDGLEPFPISLRGINWIKFLTKYGINDSKINDSLYAQYDILVDNLEYHLLGNHLLENGFSLLYGAYYFQDDKLYSKAKEILSDELQEQILEDGGHFELSPMYHQLILFRLLDCINLVKNNLYKDKELLSFLNQKASLMLGWLDTMTYQSGHMPLFNDSANGVAPTAEKIFAYARRLDISYSKKKLNESGYRKIIRDKFECVVDVGSLGPDYIPGHAHSDTFNFELYIDNKPFIIDTGLSTYNIGQVRGYERSTKAHNTVEVNGENSSEVWGGFRVAGRAKVVGLIEKDNFIQASHDGYKKIGVYHTRKWEFSDKKVTIEDTLNKTSSATARFYFSPNVSREGIEKRIILYGHQYKIRKDYYSPEFNKRVPTLVLEVDFEKELIIDIRI